MDRPSAERLREFAQFLAQRLRNVLLRLGAAALPKEAERLAVLRLELRAAGFESVAAPELFFGARLFAALLCAGLWLFFAGLGPGWSVRVVVAAFLPAGAAYLLPTWALRIWVARRRERFFRELPDFLDMLLIGLDAGLGFDAALERSCRELRDVAPLSASEWQRVQVEMRGGLSRREALLHLRERATQESLSQVVGVLLQAARYGTEVSSALRAQAQLLRAERQQRAREKGARVPVKLVLPLAIFVLPATLAIVMGPALIRLWERLGGG